MKNLFLGGIRKILIKTLVTIDSNSRTGDGIIEVIGYEDGDITFVLGGRHVTFESKLAFEQFMIEMQLVYNTVHKGQLIKQPSTEVTSVVRIGDDYELGVKQSGSIFHEGREEEVLGKPWEEKKKKRE